VRLERENVRRRTSSVMTGREPRAVGGGGALVEPDTAVKRHDGEHQHRRVKEAQEAVEKADGEAAGAGGRR
jgi:hypothetical protein